MLQCLGVTRVSYPPLFLWGLKATGDRTRMFWVGARIWRHFAGIYSSNGNTNSNPFSNSNSLPPRVQ